MNSKDFIYDLHFLNMVTSYNSAEMLSFIPLSVEKGKAEAKEGEVNVATDGRDAEVIKLWESVAVILKERGAGETGNMSGFLEYEGEKWEWRAGTDSDDEARAKDGRS